MTGPHPIGSAPALRAVAARLGDTDCEGLRDAGLAQPVNATTSLAYVALGVAIAIGSARSGEDRSSSIAFAGCVAAIGLGSFAFHGPQPTGSGPAHDLPIAVTIVFMALHDLQSLRRRPQRPWAVLVAVTAVLAIVAALRSSLVVTIAGSAVATLLVAEYLGRWRPVLAHGTARQRSELALIAALGAMAGVTWLGGRSSSPLCAPEALVQLHGLWHVSSSLLLGGWWWLAVGSVGATEPTAITRRRPFP